MNILQKIFLGFNIAAVITLLVIITLQDRKLRSVQQIEQSHEIQMDSVVREKDSIFLEYVQEYIRSVRYEVALEILKDRNPRSAEEFEKIHLTELQ